MGFCRGNKTCNDRKLRESFGHHGEGCPCKSRSWESQQPRDEWRNTLLSDLPLERRRLPQVDHAPCPELAPIGVQEGTSLLWLFALLPLLFVVWFIVRRYIRSTRPRKPRLSEIDLEAGLPQ